MGRSFAYPVALHLDGRRVVVVGADAVAMGKVEGLLEAGALVTVVAEGPPRRLAALEALDGVAVRRRPFRPEDLEGAFVCVASSPAPGERRSIYEAGRSRGVLMNLVDDVPHCDFATPALVRRGDLAIAISTGGGVPALARRLREELEERFGPEWEEAVAILAEVRRETLPLLPGFRERAERWRAALDLDELLELVREERGEEARDRLLARLVGDVRASPSPTRGTAR